MDKNSLASKIINELDIVDFIGQDINLIKRGNNYVGICPFHEDTKPSYTVNRDKKYSKCFVCGSGGNVISYYQKRKNITYEEALKDLANEIGITYKTKVIEKTSNHILLEDINDYYQVVLNLGEIGNEVREYLESRGYSKNDIEYFKLGFAPKESDKLNTYLNSKLENGLYGQINIERYLNYGSDIYRNRLMIPIFDDEGRIVGFSGRSLGNDTPKYLNSREDETFHKKNVLYNLNNAKRYSNNEIILVEGFFDVFAMRKLGYNNVVAIMGTAFTSEHMTLLLDKYKYKKIVLSLDQDEPGQKTNLKIGEMLLKRGFNNIEVVKFNQAKDVDELLESISSEKATEIVAKRRDYFQYKIHELKKHYDMQNVEDKTKYIRVACNGLKSVDEIKRASVIQELSEVTKIDVQTLNQIIGNQKQANVTKKVEPKKRISKFPTDDDALIKYCLIGKENYNQIKKQVFQNQYMFKQHQELFDLLDEYYLSHVNFDLLDIMDLAGKNRQYLIEEIVTVEEKQGIDLDKVMKIFSKEKKAIAGKKLFTKRGV